MDPGLKHTLLELMDLLLRLEVPSQSRVAVDEEVVDHWQAALRHKDSDEDTWDIDAWLREDHGRALCVLLRVFREDKSTIENILYFTGDYKGIEPNAVQNLELRLTKAAIDCCDRRDWLWLRLKMLQAVQAGDVGPDVFHPFGLGVDSVKLVRDAAIFVHAFPDGRPALPADDPDFHRAVSSLSDTLSTEHRRLFKENAVVREAVSAMKIDPDGCLALDAAAAYAAQRRAEGDRQTATVVDLISYLLVEGGSGEPLFPDKDWKQLREELAQGNTETLARLAEGNRLMKLLLALLYGHAPATVSPPEAWLTAAVREHWAPFRDEVLGEGINYVANALSLLAAIHVATAAEADLPQVVRERADRLGLYEPVEASGQFRLQCLADAVLALDAQAFRMLVCDKEAGALTAEFLTSPSDCRSLSEGLRLEPQSVYQRVYELWKQHLPSAGEVSREPPEVQALIGLARAGLLARRQGSEESLDELAGDIGLGTGELVGCCLSGNYTPMRAVPAGKLLRFLRNHRHEAWLQSTPEDHEERPERESRPLKVDEHIRALADRQRGRLVEQLRDGHGQTTAKEASGDPNSGLNIAHSVLRDDATDEDVLRKHEINREQLEELKWAFYEDQPEPLTQTFPAATVPEEEVVEPVAAPRPKRRITAVRVYLVLLAVMVITYAALHLWVTSWSQQGPTTIIGPAPPPKPPPLPTTTLRDFLAKLRLTKLNGLEVGGKPIYIRTEPVRYVEFAKLVSIPTGYTEAAETAQNYVDFAIYHEAQQFCRRLLAYAKAQYGELFDEKGSPKGELAGYVFRLPTLEEAQKNTMESLSVGDRFDAEWIQESSGKWQEQSPLAPRLVRLLKPPDGGKPDERRRPMSGRVTFRYVLAPRQRP